jgi:hypothetical protein
MASPKTTAFHFEDLDPGQFEDLVYDLVYPYRNWIYLDPVGRAGSDEGRDLEGEERVPRKPTGRLWRVQAKRMENLGPKAIEAIVDEAVRHLGLVPHGFLLVTNAVVSSKGFAAFQKKATALGIVEADVWDRSKLGQKLRTAPFAEIRSFYFGGGPAIEGTVRLPLVLAQSPATKLPLVGRDAEVAAVNADQQDLVIQGRPAVGKSRLALGVRGVRFVNHRADPDAIRDSIQRRHPRAIALDDAGLNLDALRTLLELRRARHRFRIVATVWPHHLADVERMLPTARVINLEPLERTYVDEVVRGLGVTNPILRDEILDQAAGRLGWAVALSEMAKKGPAEITSGAALVREVEPYLRHVGSGSKAAVAYLGLLATLGAVTASSLPEMDAFLSMGRLDRIRVIDEAAASGVLDSKTLENGEEQLSVAPHGVRLALGAYELFGPGPHGWTVDEVARQWPAHRYAILETTLVAAEAGFASASSALDRLVRKPAALDQRLLARYVALSERNARKAFVDTANDELAHRVVVETAARRFLLDEAVTELLDRSLVETGPEHPSPNNPTRVLGEIGQYIIPSRGTTFYARRPLLKIVCRWFDADPTAERSRSLARLAIHLMSPAVSGNYRDPGDQRKITMQAGFESSTRLLELEKDIWPEIEKRIPKFDQAALSKLVELLGDWARVGEGMPGDFGTVPAAEAQTVAAAFAKNLADSLEGATSGFPAARVKLVETSRMFHLGVRPPADREFRILTWRAWRALHKHERLVHSVAQRLASEWASTDPHLVMARLNAIGASAQAVGSSLDPMARIVLAELAAQVSSHAAWISAGLDVGLGPELGPLMDRDLDSATTPPTWFVQGLASDTARRPAILAALIGRRRASIENLAVNAMSANDSWLLEQVVWASVRSGSKVALKLLRHPDPVVRGQAAISLGLDPKKQLPVVPAAWYPDWARAIEDAPLVDDGHDGYRVAELLPSLISKDPDAVERWVRKALSSGRFRAHDLPIDDSQPLSQLPSEHRERLVREFADSLGGEDVVAALLGDDIVWLQTILDKGLIDGDMALTAISRSDKPVERIPRLLAAAKPLVDAGVDPRSIAWHARFGTFMGEASQVAEALRAAFEAAAATTPEAVAVRLAAIELYQTERDSEAQAERSRRVGGDHD